MPIRGNKRVFVQSIAKKLHIKHKQALEFVNAYSGVVMQGVREDGFSLLPDIGSLARGVRNLRSHGDKDETTKRSGGGTANRKYKKAYLKFAPQNGSSQEVRGDRRRDHLEPKDHPRWREPKPASMEGTQASLDEASRDRAEGQEEEVILLEHRKTGHGRRLH